MALLVALHIDELLVDVGPMQVRLGCWGAFQHPYESDGGVLEGGEGAV